MITWKHHGTGISRGTRWCYRSWERSHRTGNFRITRWYYESKRSYKKKNLNKAWKSGWGRDFGDGGDASPGTPLDESGDNNTLVNYHIDYNTSPALNWSGHSSDVHLADELLAEESKLRAHNNEVRRINLLKYYTCPKESSDPDRYAVIKSAQETISTVDKNSRSKIP